MNASRMLARLLRDTEHGIRLSEHLDGADDGTAEQPLSESLTGKRWR
jgi:hypothetical protein